MAKSLFLFLSILLLSTFSLYGQEPDTVQLVYRFTPGEVVTYRVVSTDSIVMMDSVRRVYASERVEIVEYRCDTILTDGYVMTMTLREFAASESLDGMAPITRVTHPWVGRQVTFLMSATGKRVNVLELSKEPGVAPGGPFAPLLLPPLGDSTTHVDASKAYSHAYWLFDNVYPPVYWKGTTFRVIPRRESSRVGDVVVVSLSDVATVAYKLPGTEIISQTIVNGAGTYRLSPTLGYMTDGFYELVGRITIKLPTKRDATGSHRMRTRFEMVTPESDTTSQANGR